MLRKIQRKAQAESFSSIMWVIALLVLVVVALGIWGVYKYFQGKQSQLPTDLSVAVEACKGYASLSGTSFCEFKEANIGGVNQWVNCPYIHVEAAKIVNQDKIGFTSTAQSCANEATAAKAKCSELSTQLGYNDKVKVNGKSCVTDLVVPIPIVTP